MAILTVGPTSTFPTIAAAMAAAGTGDIISLEAGYGNENAMVTVNGLSFDGGPSSTDINLQLASGISAITLLGTAPINVLDGPDANAVVGNDGDNIITVSSGVDVVTAGNGTDRLIIDYSAATASITGTTVNVTDGGTHAVTFTGVEDFTITTGSGNDTITVADGSNVLTTGGGDDTITAGNGPNIIDGGANNDTITAGSGVNTIDGGLGNDTIVAGDGGNTVDGGAGDDGITTGAGNDVVVAGLGNDTVITGAGSDVTTVNGGIDTVDSGSESDRLIVDFSSSTTNVNGGVTGGTLVGGYDGAFADVAGTSSVVFQGTENFTVTTGSGSDVIATGDGDDVMDGGASSDQLNSGGGADTLLIGLGSDALDGGAGTDTAIFSGARANYQVNDLGGGVIQTIDLRAGSPDGTDTLVNIEGFIFTDGTFDAGTVLNDPPVSIAVLGGGNLSVAEYGLGGSANGTVVGTVVAQDPDNNTGFTYSLSNDATGRFTIDASTGVITVLDGTLLDNEQSATHDIAVHVVDAGGQPIAADPVFTVTITNVDPELVIGNANANTFVGGPLNDQLFGNGGVDNLTGAGGNDLIHGGDGADTMTGGQGDDTYAVDNLGDNVSENPGEGNDVAYAAVSGYTLEESVETLWLVGAATSGFGNSGGGVLVGNAAVNSTLTGGSGKELIVGAHTNAITTMIGGAGDDTYVTFNSSDVIAEAPNGGNDSVYASVDYVLPADVETLWLVGSATQGTSNAQGGVLVANGTMSSTISGGAAADLLVGAHDVTSTLAGGGGDDTFVVFQTGDTIQEGANGGNDSIYSNADFMLPDNIETLWLTGGATHATSGPQGGTLVANNNLASTLTGGAGNDLMVGSHASITTMNGGAGDDTFVSFNAGDILQESTSGGNDTLVTHVSNTASGNIETMFLAESAGAIDGTGGASADTIIGNSSANVIDGRGGMDVLVGGGGNDSFEFRLGESNGDLITDFAGGASGGGDSLRFEGYGTAETGATFIQIDSTHWQINSADGVVHDTITLLNGAPVQTGDFLFV